MVDIMIIFNAQTARLVGSQHGMPPWISKKNQSCLQQLKIVTFDFNPFFFEEKFQNCQLAPSGRNQSIQQER